MYYKIYCFIFLRNYSWRKNIANNFGSLLKYFEFIMEFMWI